MANKIINLAGYGRVVYTPINIKEKDFEKVDINGNPITWIKGSATRGYYEDKEGNEVPTSHVRKKVEIDGEVILVPKFNPTTDVSSDEIEILDNDDEVQSAVTRKAYNAFTDSEKLKKIILKDKKSLKFPLVIGHGDTMYNGILTEWKGQIGLFGVLGNLNDGFKKFSDETVEIEISSIPLDRKKLLRAIAN